MYSCETAITAIDARDDESLVALTHDGIGVEMILRCFVERLKEGKDSKVKARYLNKQNDLKRDRVVHDAN